MKQLVLLSALLLSVFSFGQLNQVDAQGQKQGKWQKKYENSNQVRYNGQFLNDIPTGTFHYFHQSGARMSTIVYRGESYIGYATMFERGGWKMAEGLFDHGLRDSVWRYYGPGGQLVTTTEWSEGKRNGVETTYFHEGNIAEVTHWSFDQKEGEWIRRYQDGSVRARGTFQGGKLHGEVQFYGQNGKPEWIGSYVNGLKNGTWYIFNEGKLQYRETYEMGFLRKTECVDPEGCPESEEERLTIEELFEGREQGEGNNE